MSISRVPGEPETAPRSRWTGKDLWAFAQAWALLLAADLGLRALPFARVDRWFSPGVSGEPEEAAVGRLVWATEAAARHHLYPMRCPSKALTLRRLIARHGIESELRIGVARQDGGLSAHAWVERRGAPVGETREVEERFAILRPRREVVAVPTPGSEEWTRGSEEATLGSEAPTLGS